jgi:hypothetical protein
MINETTQQLVLDYIEGKLSEAECKQVEQLLSENIEVRTWYEQMKEIDSAMKASSEWKPSAALRESFHVLLQQEIEAERKTKSVFFNPVFYRAAAAIALVVTIGSLGFWYNKQQAKDAEILALRKEMEATRALVFALLENDQSASQRLMGVKAAYETTQKDDAIVSALIKVMNEDANMNVRIAAVEALGKFSNERIVQTALIESLPKQTDPAVQMALIQVLVQMKEQGAVESLQKIIEDETVIESVKDEAHAGIIKLS